MDDVGCGAGLGLLGNVPNRVPVRRGVVLGDFTDDDTNGEARDDGNHKTPASGHPSDRSHVVDVEALRKNQAATQGEPCSRYNDDTRCDDQTAEKSGVESVLVGGLHEEGADD